MIRRKEGKLRIVLYSHDTMGLGHVRRNLLIAQTLAKSSLRPNILLFSGAVEAKSFHLPGGVDCMTLPSLYKEMDGEYRPRSLRVSLDEIIDLRREILRASIAAFDPDLVVIDTAPWGVAGELDSTLENLAAEGRARMVLGMRDVWDEPAVISQEWERKKNWEAIRRYYDQVWVYGDPLVYDSAREYSVEGDIAQRFRFTGYLGRRADSLTPTVEVYANHPLHTYKGRYVLCLNGGGQDGVLLAETFLKADLPRGQIGLVVAGPFMDPGDLRRLKALAAENGRMKVLDFIPEPISLIRRAEAVVSMGGYNAVCEILSFRRRAMIVPRVRPRQEQLIRAERLSRLGVLEFLHPDDLRPEAVTRFLARNAGKEGPIVPFNMNGLGGVLSLAEGMVEPGQEIGRIPLESHGRD